MARLMFDSDSLSVLLGLHADLCATYADLLDAAKLAQLETHYGAVVIIDRGLGDPLGKASAIDVESGAVSPAQAKAKLEDMHARDIPWPTVYANRSTMPEVDAACQGIPYWRWYATLDGTMRIAEHPYSTVQFAGAGSTGIHADVSVVWDDQWHRAPALNGEIRHLAQLAHGEVLTAGNAIGVAMAKLQDLLTVIEA